MDIPKIFEHYGYDLSFSDKINCPFHADEEASLSVDLSKGLFYCFGCTVKGDIIEFVSRLEKINRLKALMKINKILDGTSHKNLGQKPITVKDKIPKKQWLKRAYITYKEAFIPDWNFDDYLVRNRMISPQVLKKLDVRVDPTSDYPYIFPIKEKGKFKGFVRRCKDNRADKYLYNKGFRRKDVLMGDYKKGTVFVTEGVLDFIKAYQYGVRNLVCLLGWKASDQHIKKIKSVTNDVVSMLDNDQKGKEGTEYLQKHFNVIKFPYPDEVKDVCELSYAQFLKSLRKGGI